MKPKAVEAWARYSPNGDYCGSLAPTMDFCIDNWRKEVGDLSPSDIVELLSGGWKILRVRIIPEYATCAWTPTPLVMDLWESDCGKRFDFDTWGSPARREMEYCPFCGLPIEERPAVVEEKS